VNGQQGPGTGSEPGDRAAERLPERPFEGCRLRGTPMDALMPTCSDGYPGFPGVCWCQPVPLQILSEPELFRRIFGCGVDTVGRTE